MRRLIVACVLLLMTSIGVQASEEAASLRFVTQDFPPFSYAENDQAAGPFKDIADAVCKEAKLECPVVVLPWGRAQDLVRRGGAEVLFPIGWNKDRGEWLRPSSAVVRTEYGFFANAASGYSYVAEEDLIGRKIGVYGPSNTSHLLHTLWKRSKWFTIDMRPDSESGFFKLGKRRVDLVFSNVDVGNAIIRQNDIQDVVYAGTYQSVEYVFAFTLADAKQEYIDRFLVAFETLKKRGLVSRILLRHGLHPVP